MKTTGKYVKTNVAGEIVRAFIPNVIPPRLAKNELSALELALQAAV